MTTTLHVSFVAGAAGEWSINRLSPVIGDSLNPAAALSIIEGHSHPLPDAPTWALHGTVSNIRYTTRIEAEALAARQQPLKRPEAVCAALIPIRKSPSWWALTQDERRSIFEEQSQHIGIGMAALPGVSRRLHHCRDLGEPFDFLTWFEYAPEHSDAFERMVDQLRATPEWHYIDREVDIRLTR